jgi:glycosyltransferase involved in cell wall biosynthesis
VSSVAVIHPWFPQYRQAFFENVVRTGPLYDLDVNIFHGAPPPEWAERGDSVRAEYATPLRTRFIRLGGRSLIWKSLSAMSPAKNYDLIVVEQAIRNLETYCLMLDPRTSARVCTWGHGGSYVHQSSRLEERLKRWITNRSRWFFAYTSGGADAVISHGFPADRITVLRNTIDTRQLKRDLDEVSDRDVLQFARVHDLHGSTALFLGGLDTSKRLPFLLEACARVSEEDGDFRLLIAGDGSDRKLVEAASESMSFIRYLGRVGGREKALAMRSSEVIAMPGRVGLLAVDSLVAGLPIVTTNWPWHAPEFEYLVPDKNSIVSDNTIDGFAGSMQLVLSDPHRLERLVSECLRSAVDLGVDAMSANFLDGLQHAVANPR